MLSPHARSLILCGYPLTDELQSPTIPMLIVRAIGRQALFASLWLVGDAPGDSSFRQLDRHDGRLVFEVRAGGSEARHLLPALR